MDQDHDTEILQGTRLYVTEPLAAGAAVMPSVPQIHYLLSVMRLKDGEPVRLFNGRDGEWLGRLAMNGRRSCQLVPERQLRVQSASVDLWLLFAPIRQARMDVLIEKATELGATCLIPVRTRRGQVGRINVERLGALAIEAAEQCERLDVPVIEELTDLTAALARIDATRPVFACIERADAPALAKAASSHQGPAAVLVGPEGGFDQSEKTLITNRPGVVPVALGPRVLRAETAAIAALAIWQAHAGDWRLP